MKQSQVNDILDKALEADFSDIVSTNVPMVVPEKVNIPADTEKEQELIKQNLYDTSAKLSAVMDFLVNNIESLTQEVGMIKTSPVNDICSVAKEIGVINDRLYKYTQPVVPKSFNVTQNNINSNNKKKDESEDNNNFSLETLDNLIKAGKVK